MLLLQNDRQCLQPQQRSVAAVHQLASACRQTGRLATAVTHHPAPTLPSVSYEF